MFKKLFCNHKWETIEKNTLASPFKQLTDAGMQLKKLDGDAISTYTQTFIHIMVCKECGKVEKTIVRSFDV